MDPNSEFSYLIRHLRAHVPRYRDCPEDFHRLPVVTRPDLIRERRSFISTGHGVDPAELMNFIERMRHRGSDVAFHSNVLLECTSGSSGLPLLVPKTKEERVVMAQAIWRSRRRYDSEATVRNYLPVVNATSNFGRRFQFDTPSACSRFWEHIAQAAVRWLHATPAILRRLAQVAELRQASDGLRFVESTGQALSKADHELIKRRLGVHIVNQYACREVWVIGHGWATEDFEILADNVHVEIMDNHDQPVADGIEGRVVVTSRHQRLFPLVRYDTGDHGRLYTDELGRRRLALSGHRPHELLLGARAPISGVTVFKPMLKHVYAEIGHIDISYLQIFQKSPDQFVVLMADHPEAERVRALLAKNFKRARLLAFPVTFELVVRSAEELAVLSSAPKFSMFTNVAPKLGSSV